VVNVEDFDARVEGPGIVRHSYPACDEITELRMSPTVARLLDNWTGFRVAGVFTHSTPNGNWN
jgi:hypothetical protein